jgi:hypothetical protein
MLFPWLLAQYEYNTKPLRLRTVLKSKNGRAPPIKSKQATPPPHQQQTTMPVMLLLLLLTAAPTPAFAVQGTEVAIAATITTADQFVEDAARGVVYCATKDSKKIIAISNIAAASATTATLATFPKKPTGVALIDTYGLYGLFVTQDKCIMFVDLSSGNALHTVAGSCSASGSTDGLGSVARVDKPGSLVLDASVSPPQLFFGDKSNHCYKKGVVTWASSTVSAMELHVSTVAGQCGSQGTVDGSALSGAKFESPTTVAITSDGLVMFTGMDGSPGVMPRRVGSMLDSASGTRTVSTISLTGHTNPTAFKIAIHPAHSTQDDVWLYLTGYDITVITGDCSAASPTMVSTLVATYSAGAYTYGVLPLSSPANMLLYGASTGLFQWTDTTWMPAFPPAAGTDTRTKTLPSTQSADAALTPSSTRSLTATAAVWPDTRTPTLPGTATASLVTTASKTLPTTQSADAALTPSSTRSLTATVAVSPSATPPPSPTRSATEAPSSGRTLTTERAASASLSSPPSATRGVTRTVSRSTSQSGTAPPLPPPPTSRTDSAAHSLSVLPPPSTLTKAVTDAASLALPPTASITAPLPEAVTIPAPVAPVTGNPPTGVPATPAATPLDPLLTDEGTGATTVTAISGVAGGPGAALIQGAAITLTMCASAKKDAETVGAKNALVPYVIGTSRLRAWYGIVSLMAGAAAAHTVVLAIVTAAFTAYRNAKGALAAESSDDEEADDAGDAAMADSFGGASTSAGVGAAAAAAAAAGGDVGGTLRARMWLASRWCIYPGLAFKVVLFGFQGFLAEGLALVGGGEGTTVGERVLGAASVLACLAFTAAVQLSARRTVAERYVARPEILYVPYVHVWPTVPWAVRVLVVPRGYWRGALSLAGRFRPYGMFSGSHVKWVSTCYLVRAIILGVCAVIQPTTDFGCMLLYIFLMIVFTAFALLFAVARPHRSALDDAVASFLNVLSAAMCIIIGFKLDASVTTLYFVIVYTAIAFVIITFARLLFEFRVLRRAEAALRRIDGAAAREAAYADAAAPSKPDASASLRLCDVDTLFELFDSFDAASSLPPRARASRSGSLLTPRSPLVPLTGGANAVSQSLHPGAGWSGQVSKLDGMCLESLPDVPLATAAQLRRMSNGSWSLELQPGAVRTPRTGALKPGANGGRPAAPAGGAHRLHEVTPQRQNALWTYADDATTTPTTETLTRTPGAAQHELPPGMDFHLHAVTDAVLRAISPAEVGGGSDEDDDPFAGEHDVHMSTMNAAMGRLDMMLTLNADDLFMDEIDLDADVSLEAFGESPQDGGGGTGSTAATAAYSAPVARGAAALAATLQQLLADDDSA